MSNPPDNHGGGNLTTRNRRSKKQQTAKDLSIFQANVGKRSSAHDAALELASQCEADIILIQEPWIYSGNTRKFTKTHPNYHAFAPLPE